MVSGPGMAHFAFLVLIRKLSCKVTATGLSPIALKQHLSNRSAVTFLRIIIDGERV